MAAVELEARGDVAVVWLNNPPVNALGVDVRKGIADALTQAGGDASIKAIVLASRLQTFSGGADIREFGKPPLAPTLRDIILTIEAGTKPAVAAIEGVALGGGLEIALACDARLATPTARLGLPETNLGLLPGAGGTQRLPRLIGAVAALPIMADAKPRAAHEALRLGVVDEVVPAEGLLDAAIARARGLASAGRRRVRDGVVDAGTAEEFEAIAARLIRSRSGEPQIEALVDSVRATFSKAFDDGLRIERAHFEALLVDARSEALRHMFFAERQASGLPRGAAAAEPRAIGKVGVIGGGTMGAGIAMAFAAGGISVVLKETTAEAAEQAVARIRATYDRSVAKGSLGAAARDEIMARIAPARDFGALSDAGLVVEAAFEDIAVKRSIFTELAQATPPTAILATNTSYLDIDRIAEAVEGRSRVAGMHFFSPAHVMKLVEIVKGAETSGETLATIIAVARKIGKLPVVVGNCHGFVGNRMLARRSEQVDRLLLEGASPAEVDAALTGFGFKLGPCAMSDLAGLDISWRMRRATGRSAPAADALVEAGRLGQKSGRGYYRYGEDGRTPADDPTVVRIIAEAAARLGIERRRVGSEEILDRLLLPTINEATRILDEGVASKPSDIDVIWVHGYGFPRHRGGPMFYAATRGFGGIAARLRQLAEITGDDSLSPAPYLVKLADEAETAP